MNDTARSASPNLRVRVRHAVRRSGQVVWHTLSMAWSHSIFSKAATAAFWQTLSLPPLLLGLLGSLGYVGGWFGPDTVDIITSKIVTFTRTAFSDSVVDQIIQPTVEDVLNRGRADVMSVGFVLSLWAGSSAISTFVDSIVEAHHQQNHRNPIWQRIFGLLLYVMFLILAVFTLPLVALGPTIIGRLLPDSWYTLGSSLVDTFYYPGVGLLLLLGLTTLYKVALPKSLPWHRLLGGALVAGAFFMASSVGLRWYLTVITSTGYTYGALAAPIAFLLFTFFLGFAIVLGAEFNATVQEFWPARATRMEQWKEWLSAQADQQPSPELGAVTNLTRRITAASPIRISDLLRPGDQTPEAWPLDSNAQPDLHVTDVPVTDRNGRTPPDRDGSDTDSRSEAESGHAEEAGGDTSPPADDADLLPLDPGAGTVPEPHSPLRRPS
ncbi:YihY/virulence factor BrkB family protein [Rhodococcus coprophilus]|uniref:YihY/virulence factor BrkB family protein n=1 Tax=Rhodococcus coprophilus TaxID=38310 RepID=UPI00093424BC|nr:YihY/virulence factor BrkB family protein [Rhodococcus coprophilus]MBM7461243.1 membrane protein [Rhodococcus coprophilus]